MSQSVQAFDKQFRSVEVFGSWLLSKVIEPGMTHREKVRAAILVGVMAPKLCEPVE